MAAGRSDNVISIKVILHDVHTLYSLIMVSDIREVRVCMFVRTVLIVVYTQVVFGGFMWAAYFSMLTSFAPSYGWFIFLRSMVGCGVAATSQGYTHTYTHTHFLSLNLCVLMGYRCLKPTVIHPVFLLKVYSEDRIHSC